jgi:hypothetical protein
MNDVRQTIIKVIRVTGVLLLVGSCWYISFRIRNSVTVLPPEPTPVPIVYEIESLPAEWEMLWETTSIRLASPNIGLSLTATSENALALAFGGALVMKIDLLTGATSRCRIRSSAPVTMFAANEEMFFVGLLGRARGGPITRHSTWGATKIEAYLADSCGQAWSQPIPGAQYLYNFVFATETIISTYGANSANYYLLDTVTGDILEALPKRDSNFIWKINEDENVIYVQSPRSPFIALDRDTSKTLWRSPLTSYGIVQSPMFTDQVITARVGPIRHLGRVIAINRDTGDLLWEMENVVSNVTLGRDYLFLITQDMQLVALDPMTGTAVSQLEFKPDEIIGTSSTNIFQVAASDDIVVVYLGDGNQLMAFRFSLDG